jgi:hypothetical protein
METESQEKNILAWLQEGNAITPIALIENILTNGIRRSLTN